MKYFPFSNIRALFFGPALLLLASCGSYQYTGYEHDGIYSPENREAVTANDHAESYEEALYYKQLFAQKAEQFSNIPQEGAIFTDIEGYTSTGMYEDQSFMQEGIAYQGGNAPWGQEVDEISINVYNSPFFSPFYHPYMSPYYGGFYDPFWMNRYGYGYGYGWNHWGYGYPYHNPWRWNRWGWNAGLAVHSPFYGYYRYGNYNPYYSRNNVAYNSTRRSSYTDYNNSSIVRNNSKARSSRIQDYSNSRGIRAERSSALLRSNRGDNDDRTYSTRTTRVESPKSRSRSNSNSTYRSSNSRSYERSTQARSSRSTRSYDTNRQVRRSTSTSRSSGTMRSSSSTPRSSGTSSSRSSRGRGN